MNSVYSMMVTTCADMENAKGIAKTLIANRLAACVQMLPVESVYFWHGRICDENEIVLFIKTKSALFAKIAEAIKQNHPYKIPEIIQLPITDGLPDYLSWIGGYVVDV